MVYSLWSIEKLSTIDYRQLTHGYFAYSIARVSLITVTLT